jgi:mannose-6-phosphate isomerase-like protein (cupin superfamily)
MIRRTADMATEVREHMRGGQGRVTIRHLFQKEEITARTRLCARLTLPPGASIGPHTHEGEDELYVILKGEGLLDDGTARTPVTAGDAILTGKGETHAIANTGREDLDILAVIMLY